MKTRLQKARKLRRRIYLAIRAKWRNEAKQRSQTHLHQKTRMPRPVNKLAFRTRIFKETYYIK